MQISLKILLLSSLGIFLMGCGAQPDAPVRLPNPVIVNQNITTYWFDPTKLDLEIRNDGAAGTVHVEVYTIADIGGQTTYGESGVEKALRESFTRKIEPAPVYHPNYVRTPQAIENVVFQADETKTLKITLPQYRPSLFGNEELKIEVSGISVMSAPL